MLHLEPVTNVLASWWVESAIGGLVIIAYALLKLFLKKKKTNNNFKVGNIKGHNTIINNQGNG